MSEHASHQRVQLHDLDRADFTAWCHGAISELGQWLLFRWDPDDVEGDFPDSIDEYHGVAHSIVLGLWMGDDREVFGRRVRSDRKVYGEVGCDDESLDRIWSFVQTWLPRSLDRWWDAYIDAAERALPQGFNLVDDTSLPSGVTRDDWVNATVDVARRVMADTGVTELHTNLGTDRFPAEVALAQMRAVLDGTDGATEYFRWSSPARDLVLRICQDEDLHVSSSGTLVDAIAWARSQRLLRED